MHHIIVQRTVSHFSIPDTIQLKQWALLALQGKQADIELTLRIVDKNEIQLLNSTYRKKDKPTNVLSFPFELPNEVKTPFFCLGDIVLCAEVIFEEACQQNKAIEAHWAHMIVHGILHLQGYDHEKEKEAVIMEMLEKKILNQLGFDDPYQTEENKHAE